MKISTYKSNYLYIEEYLKTKNKTWSELKISWAVVLPWTQQTDYRNTQFLPANLRNNPKPRGCLLCPRAQNSKNTESPSQTIYLFQAEFVFAPKHLPLSFIFHHLNNPLPPPLTSRDLIRINVDIICIYGDVIHINVDMNIFMEVGYTVVLFMEHLTYI